MPDPLHRPQLKSFLISPPVRAEMAAQGTAPPSAIPVIITLKESKTEPERGVAASRQPAGRGVPGEAGLAGPEEGFLSFWAPAAGGHRGPGGEEGLGLPDLEDE